VKLRPDSGASARDASCSTSFLEGCYPIRRWPGLTVLWFVPHTTTGRTEIGVIGVITMQLSPGGYKALRWAMQLFRTITKTMTLGVRCAVIDPQGRVLLVRPRLVPGWHFPGGGIEVGETAVEALRRELFEEARVELTGDPELRGILQNTSTTVRDHEVFFVARQLRVLEERRPDFEISQCEFFPGNALPPDLEPGARRRLDEIERGVPPAEQW